MTWWRPGCVVLPGACPDQADKTANRVLVWWTVANLAANCACTSWTVANFFANCACTSRNGRELFRKSRLWFVEGVASCGRGQRVRPWVGRGLASVRGGLASLATPARQTRGARTRRVTPPRKTRGALASLASVTSQRRGALTSRVTPSRQTRGALARLASPARRLAARRTGLCPRRGALGSATTERARGAVVAKLVCFQRFGHHQPTH